jgi:uncharacterized protein with HEPN domain
MFFGKPRFGMPPLLPRDIMRLRHMRDAADRAIAFTRGYERSILDTDEMRALAVRRLVEIVGEAGRAVSSTSRAEFPTVPWRQIIGTRDRLIHGYEAVDLDILWAIVTKDLVQLVAELDRGLISGD